MDVPPDGSSSPSAWHEWALNRWQHGQLEEAEAAFRQMYKTAPMQEGPESLSVMLLDWTELSLARHDDAAAAARAEEVRPYLERAFRQGQFGSSDVATYGRLADTFQAAALRETVSPQAAVEALRALGPSPWSADHQYYLGQVLAEQGRTAEAARAFRAYLDATPRLGLLRTATNAQAEAAAFVAAHS